MPVVWIPIGIAAAAPWLGGKTICRSGLGGVAFIGAFPVTGTRVFYAGGRCCGAAVLAAAVAVSALTSAVAVLDQGVVDIILILLYCPL